jgi:hypothetical protein
MKKFSMILIFMISVALVFTSSCKSEDTFNIAGSWTGIISWTGSVSYTANYTFAGTETSGTVNIALPTYGHTGTGTYTVVGLNVTLIVEWDAGAIFNATGAVSADFNTMNGTFTQDNGYNGTWTAMR